MRHPSPSFQPETPMPAGVRIPPLAVGPRWHLLQIGARARAAVDQALAHERVERGPVHGVAVALSHHRTVSLEPEPRQVLQDRRPRTPDGYVAGRDPRCRSRTSTAVGVGQAPDIERVDDVAQMKMPGGRRREPGEHAAWCYPTPHGGKRGAWHDPPIFDAISAISCENLAPWVCPGHSAASPLDPAPQPLDAPGPPVDRSSGPPAPPHP